MTMKNLVSVIVPVYNVEKYLRTCIDSILMQSYRDIEVILIDDGSKDASGNICDEYSKKDARVRVLHKDNGGVSRARNIGLDLANGEFVTFIDGDDSIDENYIALMFQEMSSGQYDFVRLSWERGGHNYSYHVKFDSNGKYVVDADSLDDLHLCANIWGLFRATTGIRFNEKLKNGEDTLFVIENFVKSKQRMLLMDKPYYHYTIVEKSASEMTPVERLFAHKKFLSEVLLLKSFFSRIEYLVQKHLYSDYFSVMCYMIDNQLKIENNLTLKEVQSNIKVLRNNGIRFSKRKAELKYFLYKTRLVSFLKFIMFKRV